ncbi:MAG: hypothetical protein WA056_06890 [Gallionella sp.]
MLKKLIEQRDLYKQRLKLAAQMVKEKEAELDEVRQSLLRIEGAIQVLDETIEEMRKERLAEQSGSSS